MRKITIPTSIIDTRFLKTEEDFLIAIEEVLTKAEENLSIDDYYDLADNIDDLLPYRS